MSSVSRRNLLAGTAVGAFSLGVAGAASAKPKPKDDYVVDVVVLGYGGAGATTAIAAADAGATVLIVERQPEGAVRSNTRMSGGYIHSPDKNGDRQALKSYFVGLFSGKFSEAIPVGEDPKISERMAEYWTEYSPRLHDWILSLDPQVKMLKTGGGAQYKNFPGAKECAYAVYRTSYPDRVSNTVSTYNLPKEQATEGEALFRALENGVNARKTQISILYGARGESLITAPKGEVVGLIAEKDGHKVRIRARKAVVLCSGGYEYNEAMRKAFLPGLGKSGWAFYGTPYNEGDGIRMGLDVGAGLTKAGACAARMIWAPPVYYNGMRIGVTTVGVGFAHSMVVNSLGKRFTNEALIMGGITNNMFYEKAGEQSLKTLTYDNMPSWQIFDSRIFDTKTLANLTRSTVGYGFVDYGAADNSDALKKGWIFKADSIEALAELIAKDPDNAGRMTPSLLAQTVKDFNAACQAGSDEAFGRSKSTMKPVDQGPYYAIPLFAGGSNTKGGLSTDADKRVLDWFGRPIPGLFAVGEISCGLNRGGAMLTECLVFGLVCGEKVAKLKSRT